MADRRRCRVLWKCLAFSVVGIKWLRGLQGVPNGKDSNSCRYLFPPMWRMRRRLWRQTRPPSSCSNYALLMRSESRDSYQRLGNDVWTHGSTLIHTAGECLKLPRCPLSTCQRILVVSPRSCLQPKFPCCSNDAILHQKASLP